MSKARDAMAAKIRAHTKATEETFSKLGQAPAKERNQMKRLDTVSSKAGQFILSSRTFEVRAPSTWTDADAEDFLALMENVDVWAEMEEVLQRHLRDFQKHTPKVEKVIIRVKE